MVQQETRAPSNPAPIVWVVFDEFPVVTLMNGQYGLDGDHYPNFAKLAESSYWFRNAWQRAPEAARERIPRRSGPWDIGGESRTPARDRPDRVQGRGYGLFW